ncbi:hypothetical protein BABINDRAFT_159313 [Babjeviella inositovora NRRL Y-12698]|uniref:Amidophosphoribosyltransferase n=1 Tax=Babjeviella inositovora NRRL Y-12698 TaxID=984486 RepID=A0A1E3QYV9_9ASCO|nr:uncharacterized protein BABINDRAFT_159313 [Babjeviella inositovora NRRL Y-12698]ODQ82811.1 hypothetical protein BABINDRAFT_159313 [Babjeviella inositovora NRRL Y-12698]
MCGILGLILADQNKKVAPELLDGCMFLQHRGQDAAGITTCGNRGRFYQCKGNGMARDVFTENRVKGLIGNMGIAHLRYPTAGSSANSEAQPFYVNSPYGITMSHNGNLVNSSDLRKYLDDKVHRHINTDSDSELLLNVFAAHLETYDRPRIGNDEIFTALKGVFEQVRGAYACTAMLAGYGLIGFRDPNGVRPLLIGERTTANGQTDYMLASESVVLTAHGFTKFRDILPGEAVIIPKDTVKPEFRQVVPVQSYSPDIFEYVYFARPDSVMDGISVYRTRLEMGVKLANNIRARFPGKDIAKEIDVVIPVPDTSRNSALECAVSLGIPYREGFVKNRYVGRTFIMPDQAERRSSVRRKLNAMESEFAGRTVLIVDDSIVRGTTSKEIVSMARDAGAKKVYFASAAPAIRYNHVYGIDLADTKALVGYKRSDEEISRVIGADAVFYQDLGDLIDSVKSELISTFEIGVFTGQYVTGNEDRYLKELEIVRAQNQRIRELGVGAGVAGENLSCDDMVDVKAESDIGIYNSGDYA